MHLHSELSWGTVKHFYLADAYIIQKGRLWIISYKLSYSISLWNRLIRQSLLYPFFLRVTIIFIVNWTLETQSNSTFWVEKNWIGLIVLLFILVLIIINFVHCSHRSSSLFPVIIREDSLDCFYILYKLNVQSRTCLQRKVLCISSDCFNVSCKEPIDM